MQSQSQVTCPTCGAVNPAGKVLCISCGKAMAAIQPGSGRTTQFPQAYYQPSDPAAYPQPPAASQSAYPYPGMPTLPDYSITPSTPANTRVQVYLAKFLRAPKTGLPLP